MRREDYLCSKEGIPNEKHNKNPTNKRNIICAIGYSYLRTNTDGCIH